MIYLGYVLGMWLLIGLFYFIHIMYVDQLWDILQEEKELVSESMTSGKEFYMMILKNKINFFAVCLLSGVILISIEISIRIKTNKKRKR